MGGIIKPAHIKRDPVYDSCYDRVHYYDRNVLCIVCGAPGSCKSGSAIRMAMDLDCTSKGNTRFNLDRVVFKAQDFMELVKKKMPKGSCIIWDEIGVEADSRDYYTKRNKFLKYIFQTFRYRNLIVFMTVPDISSIDVGLRRLVTMYVEMRGPSPNKDFAFGKVEWVTSNPKSGKVYYKLPRFYDSDRNFRKLRQYQIDRPPKDFEDAYKRKKIASTEQWYRDFTNELDYMDTCLGDKKSKKGYDLGELEAEVLARTDDFLDAKGKFVPGLMELDLGCTSSVAVKLARLMNIKNKRGDYGKVY